MVQQMMLELGLAETIGPIQMGLSKPVHILDVESSVRSIVNMTAVAVLDAIVQEKIEKGEVQRVGEWNINWK